MFQMNDRQTVPVMLAALAVAAAPLAGQERRTLTGDAAAVYNIAGIVRAEAAAGGDIVVEVTRRGADGARLTIATGRIGNSETVRVLYPSDRIVYRDEDDDGRYRTTLRVNEDGTFYEGDHDDHGRGRRVTVASHGSGLDASADIVIKVPRNRRLAVFLAAGKLELVNIEGDLYGNLGAASVDVTGTKGRLSLDTGSGSVRLRSVQGDLVLDTGSGSVVMEKIGGRSLRIDSGSGSVSGRDFTVEKLDLDSGSGAISLDGIASPDIRLDAGSGRVELDIVTDVRDLRVDAGSGSVTIGIPTTLGAQIEVSTGSGGIDTDFPLTVTSVGRDRMSGTIGDGDGRIEIDGGSGRIRLRRASNTRR